MGHDFPHFQKEMLPCPLICSRKGPVGMIVPVTAGQQRRGNRHEPVIPASIWQILPDQHTEPVAVVVKAERLHLDMLAQHIKTQRFHGHNVPNECFVGGRRVKSVGPITLIQDPTVEVGLSIQEKARNAGVIFLYRNFPHGKVAFHTVVTQRDRKGIKFWALRRPGFELRERDAKRCIGAASVSIALEADIAKGALGRADGKFYLGTIEVRRDFRWSMKRSAPTQSRLSAISRSEGCTRCRPALFFCLPRDSSQVSERSRTRTVRIFPPSER